MDEEAIEKIISDKYQKPDASDLRPWYDTRPENPQEQRMVTRLEGSLAKVQTFEGYAAREVGRWLRAGRRSFVRRQGGFSAWCSLGA